jgi:hypothetical protein
MKTLFLVSSIILLFGCDKLASPKLAASLNHSGTPAIAFEHPKTPELVVRVWESSINTNHFDTAKRLSTGATLAFVNAQANLNTLEAIEETPTEILSISCREGNEEADCHCVLKDDLGKFRYNYHLIRREGFWLLEKVTSADTQTSVDTTTIDSSIHTTQ